MKTAFVGCGKIAAIHAAALTEVPEVQLCAVVDRDAHRAQAFAASVGGVPAYTDVAQMLAEQRPEAVHVLTPPSTHAEIATQVMDAGCHVLVEKPMALSVAEADAMIDAARRNGVWLSTNHNYLYNHSVARARELVAAGAIGRVVDVVNYYGVSAEESSLATGAGSHWAWRLRGGVFTNFLPHLIYLQREFLGDIVALDGVVVQGAADDPRRHSEMIAITTGTRAVGTMTVSGQVAPYMKYVDVYGTKGVLRADLVRETCTIQRHRRAPGAVSKVLFNLEQVWQVLFGTARSTVNVLSGRWQSYPGLRVLVRDFYDSIARGQQPPVTGEDGRAVVAVMEMLWDQAPALLGAEAAEQPAEAVEASPPRTAAEQRVAAQASGQTVLVTGANGYLGRHLVNALARSGLKVRALVRDRTRVPFDVEQQAEVVTAALDDRAALADAMRGADVVYHCAAVTQNNVAWTVHERTNVDGTATVVEAAGDAGVARVVHVSSVIVYGLHAPGDGAAVDETAELSSAQDPWAFYERSKILAEQAARRVADDRGVALTIARPGILYGPGRPVKSGLVRLGDSAVSIGGGRNRLPLTYVDNAVDALLLAGTLPEGAGQVFNVVDDPQLPLRQAFAASGHAGRVIPLPASLLRMAARALERQAASAKSAKPPKLTRFVIGTATRDMVYDAGKAHSLLGWSPEVDLNTGLRRSEDL